MSIYNINDITICSVVRIASEAAEGETISYNACLPRYEMIYCLEGENLVLFQGINLYDKPGCIRYLPCNTENDKYCVETVKTGEYVDIYFETNSHMPPTAFSIDCSRNKNLNSLFVKIHNIWSKKEKGYYNRCVSVFYEILYEMEKTEDKYEPIIYHKKIAPAVEYIHNNYSNIYFDYKALAKLCDISYTYFKRLFIKIYQCTPTDYVKSLKMKYACELLETQRFTVTQISEKCGFSNVYYFSKVFKETFGTPPSQYGKNNNQSLDNR